MRMLHRNISTVTLRGHFTNVTADFFLLKKDYKCHLYIGLLLVLALKESLPCGWMYFLSSMTFSDCYENVIQKHQQ